MLPGPVASSARRGQGEHVEPDVAEGHPFPGGVGLSRLRVYDTRAPDGLVGGSPHVHLCCSEGYLVLAGEGAAATLTGSGYQETLTPRAVVWFTPGTIHRLVNHCDLEIIVLMPNSGLPEAGDAVLTLPPDILGDPDRYAAAMALPCGGAPGTDLTATHRRRDLAVEGFTILRRAVDDDGPAALSAFYGAATALVRPRLNDWRRRCSRVLSPRIGGAMPSAHKAPLVSSWMKDRAQELAFACK